jgi:DNA integrity scanning protein DisA with diadenylate cyclase activity
LLLITLFIHTFFYELDYFIYVLTKYYIPTGPIVGDLILNIFVLINLVVCLFAIFYRSEVMSFLRRVLKLKPVVYIPTRADYLMIFVLRLSLLAYGVFFLYNAFVAFQYNLAFAEEKIRLDNKLMDIGHLYLTISERIDLFLYMPIILVLTDWSKERYKQSMFF